MPLTEENMILDSLRHSEVPDNLHYGIMRYICHELQPGSYLTAVLENDLLQAINRGDDDTLKGLVATVRWLFNKAPGDCWGTPRKVYDWLQQSKVDDPAS